MILFLLPSNIALGNENNITPVPVFNHKTPVYCRCHNGQLTNYKDTYISLFISHRGSYQIKVNSNYD